VAGDWCWWAFTNCGDGLFLCTVVAFGVMTDLEFYEIAFRQGGQFCAASARLPQFFSIYDYGHHHFGRMQNRRHPLRIEAGEPTHLRCLT
jgi:hypothetical protein